MPPIAQYVWNGLVAGGILALPAVSFSLLWKLLRFPNFAVSTYLTIGAFAAFAVNHGWGWRIQWAWAAALVVTGVVAWLVDRVVFHPMRERRPFALAIASILGPAVQNVVVAIAIPIIPRAARVVRATALSVKENQYVEAASSLGASWRRVILQHILPNVMAPYIIMLTAQLGSAILTEAALSYLGLGTAEPTPSWGLMLSGSAPSYAEKAPWIALFPGIAISLGVFGFNLFGDSLRDALDPKLRNKG